MTISSISTIASIPASTGVAGRIRAAPAVGRTAAAAAAARSASEAILSTDSDFPISIAPGIATGPTGATGPTANAVNAISA